MIKFQPFLSKSKIRMEKDSGIEHPELMTSDDNLLFIELENYKRGLKVIESCKHEGQLKSAMKFIRLLGEQHPGAAAALKYMYLIKVQELAKSNINFTKRIAKGLSYEEE